MAVWSRTQTLHTLAPAYKRRLVCFCHAAHMLQHLTWLLLIHPVMSPLHSPKYFLNSLGWMVQSVLKKDKLKLVSQLMKMVYCNGFKNFLLPLSSLSVARLTNFTVMMLQKEGPLIVCVVPCNVVHVPSDHIVIILSHILVVITFTTDK